MIGTADTIKTAHSNAVKIQLVIYKGFKGVVKPLRTLLFYFFVI